MDQAGELKLEMICDAPRLHEEEVLNEIRPARVRGRVRIAPMRARTANISKVSRCKRVDPRDPPHEEARIERGPVEVEG